MKKYIELIIIVLLAFSAYGFHYRFDPTVLYNLNNTETGADSVVFRYWYEGVYIDSHVALTPISNTTGMYGLDSTVSEAGDYRIKASVFDASASVWMSKTFIFTAKDTIPNVAVSSIDNGAITAAAVATGAIDDDAVADGAIDVGGELDTSGLGTGILVMIDSLKDTVEDMSTRLLADVSSLATSAQATAIIDSTDVIHQKLYFLGLSDSSSAGSTDTTAIKHMLFRGGAGVSNMEIFLTDTIDVARDATKADYIGGAGSGAYSCSLWVRDTANAAYVPSVALTVNNQNEDGTALTQNTNTNGYAVFSLDNGDYRALVNAPPGIFSSTDFTIASAIYNDSVLGYYPTIGTPSAASICSVYCWIQDAAGQKVKGAKVTATLVTDVDTTIDGNMLTIDSKALTDMSDTDGYWSLGLIKTSVVDTNSYYTFEISRNGTVSEKANVWVPDSSTVNYNDLLRSFKAPK